MIRRLFTRRHKQIASLFKQHSLQSSLHAMFQVNLRKVITISSSQKLIESSAIVQKSMDTNQIIDIVKQTIIKFMNSTFSQVQESQKLFKIQKELSATSVKDRMLFSNFGQGPQFHSSQNVRRLHMLRKNQHQRSKRFSF